MYLSSLVIHLQIELWWKFKKFFGDACKNFWGIYSWIFCRAWNYRNYDCFRYLEFTHFIHNFTVHRVYFIIFMVFRVFEGCKKLQLKEELYNCRKFVNFLELCQILNSNVVHIIVIIVCSDDFRNIYPHVIKFSLLFRLRNCFHTWELI